MKFDKLKPGMFLVAKLKARNWTIIKHKLGNKVIFDDYWDENSSSEAWGHLYKAYNSEREKNLWNHIAINRSYRLATTKDAQDLIVTMFEKA